MRIQNIVAPVDFSPASCLAVNYGIALARKFGAKLTLLHVIESPGSLITGFPPVSPIAEKELRDRAVRMLSALVSSEDQDDVDLGIVVKSGGIEDVIYSSIKELAADIVVMGTHGRGLFGRWLIGSVTQNVLRKFPIPILTVCSIVRPMAFNRMLFATDLSDASKGAFGYALDLARTVGSDIVVFHALEPVGVAYAGQELASYVAEPNIDEIRSRLAEFVAKGARNQVKVETEVVEGTAAKSILKAVEDNDIDLIFLATQSKGFLERAFLGATAEQIIREAHVPVLAVSKAAVAAQEAAPDSPRLAG
jgi:nucleotide-binding universal stress UspA family protein